MLPFGAYYLHRKGAGPIPAGVILILGRYLRTDLIIGDN